MQETKERYDEAMRRMTICRIMAIECEEDSDADVPSYKHPGRTELMGKFLRNRCALAKQYHLSHRLIRSIVTKAQQLLPEVLCDVGLYRGLHFLDLDRYDIVALCWAINSNNRYDDDDDNYHSSRYRFPLSLSCLPRYPTNC